MDLYIIATCHAEFNLSPYMAYDVAFGRKAARYRLASWDQIDPQLYSKAFAASGKARPRDWCDHCLTSSHSSSDCPLSSSSGPAKKARVPTAGPKHNTQTQAKEICHNYNRGRCSQGDCPRRHVCLTSGLSCVTPGHLLSAPPPPPTPPGSAPGLSGLYDIMHTRA